MDRDPTQTSKRRAARQRRLGADAACFCGETAPEALERHHPLGRAHDPELTIVLCRNCHAKANESQRMTGTPMVAQSNVLDRLFACLRAAEAFLHDALHAIERISDQPEAFMGFLDKELPNWRELWRTRND